MKKSKRPKRDRESDWLDGQSDDDEQIRPSDELERSTSRNDEPPDSLEDAGLDPEQEQLIRKAYEFLRSTILIKPIYLGEPDELLYPEEPLVRRIVLMICEAARMKLSDLPPGQPDAEFQETADKWAKIKTRECEEIANPTAFCDAPRPNSTEYRRRQLIKNELWRTMVSKLVPPKPNPAIVKQSYFPAPAPGKKICPNCRKSVGSRRQVCSCEHRFPARVPKPVKLAKAEKFCPDCHMVCNSARFVCPLCRYDYRKKRPALPPYIAVLIRMMPSVRQHQLQQTMTTLWRGMLMGRKNELAGLRGRFYGCIASQWGAYWRQKRQREMNDKLKYLLALTARAILNDF